TARTPGRSGYERRPGPSPRPRGPRPRPRRPRDEAGRGPRAPRTAGLRCPGTATPPTGRRPPPPRWRRCRGHRTVPLTVRRARQGDGGEGRLVDRSEGPALGGGEVQGGGQPRQLLGVGERPADRVAHVRRAGLGDGGAV